MDNPTDRAYLGNKALDYVVRMNTELLSELWILRDRVEVLEHLLVGNGVLRRSQVDDFVPMGEFRDHIENERAHLIENVVGAPHRGSMTVKDLIDRSNRFAPKRGIDQSESDQA